MTNIAYNTERESLKLPEYGRYINDMAQHLHAIADKDERTKAANTLVQLMLQVNPQPKDLEDYMQKFWDHLHLMTDYKLDVDAPYPKPDPSAFSRKPNQLNYATIEQYKYRHYGRIIPSYIKKAKTISDPTERQALSQVIANMMKKAYLNWNRDSVEDEVIKAHLAELSEGELTLDNNFELDSKTELIGKTPLNVALSQSNKPKKRRKKNNRFKKKPNNP